MATRISSDIHFKTRIVREKEHLTMIKGPTYQEDIRTFNVHSLYNRALKYIR